MDVALVRQSGIVIFIAAGLPPVVAGSGAVLVTPPPGGPAQAVPGIPHGLDDQGGEWVADVVAGQGTRPCGTGPGVCSAVAAMVKNAKASMARVVHRYQEVGGPDAHQGRPVLCLPGSSAR